MANLSEKDLEERIKLLEERVHGTDVTPDEFQYPPELGGGDGQISHSELVDVGDNDHHARYSDEEARDAVAALLAAGGNVTIDVDDAGDTVTIGLGSDLDVGTLSIDGTTALTSVAASGEVTLTEGAAVVDTGLSATDATFYPALGLDDPDANAKVACRLFWDDAAGTYQIELVEDGTEVGNPTVNYDIVRVR